MARGERPIKLGNSWFSAKSIEVDRRVFTLGGRALDGLGGPKALPNPKTPKPQRNEIDVQVKKVNNIH